MNNRYRPINNNPVYPDVPREEIRRELTWYRENGYGGFAVNGTAHAPIPDVHEWLPGFMRSVRNYCEEAREQGLDMWIFDEWGYPSGCACGLVITPETRSKKLTRSIDLLLEAGESVTMDLPARLLCIGAIPVDRFAPYHPADKATLLNPTDNKIRFTADKRTRLVAVSWEPFSFITHTMQNDEVDPDTRGSVDILDASVVRKYLQEMHERYVPVIGDEFGKTVKGFFYDEPEICWNFPYTQSLPEHFLSRHGYPLETILPELLSYMDSECGVTGNFEAYARLKQYFDDYTDAWTSLLAESFYGQIETWCHEHNLLSVGHQDLDNHVQTLTTVSGDFFRNSLRNDRPGIDVIWNQIVPDDFTDFPRFAGSVKHLAGKSGAMSETFAEMGLGLPPEMMRYDMEHQILRGIDTFFLYTTHSSRPQPDPNIGVFTRALMDRVERVARLLNEGKPRTRIALFIPSGDIAFENAHLNPHRINGSPLPWERVDKIAQALCYAPVEFIYVWEESLDRLFESGIRYLILPGGSLSAKAAERIQTFHDAGGCVYSAINPSPDVPCAKFKASVRQLIDLLPREFRQDAPVSMASRDLGDSVLYVFLNESDGRVSSDITFDRAPYMIDPDTGETLPWDGDKIFEPRELKIFRVYPEPVPSLRVTETIRPESWKLNGAPIANLLPWSDLGLDRYTGWATYKTEFDCPGGTVQISLGEVGFAACVRINGETRYLPFSPWKFRTDLPAGHHEMVVQVLNSDSTRLFAEDPQYRWTFEERLLRCGLLGSPRIDLIQPEQ